MSQVSTEKNEESVRRSNSLRPPSPTSSIKSENSKQPLEFLEDPMISYRMLEALRKGDENSIAGIWTSWPKEINLPNQPAKKAFTTPLHLAVTGATVEINKFVITNLKGININQQDVDGNTPLHLASKGGRRDVIELLLRFEEMDDTIVNFAGHTAFDLAKNEHVKNYFIARRQEFIAEKTQFLNHHLSQPTQANVTAIVHFFAENKRSKLLDINHRHPTTGSTILHQAVSIGDAKVVSQLLKMGGNVFARDKRGKSPSDLARDENVKDILRRETSSSVVASDPDQLPRLEGQLKKWTNYAGGYKARWFKLENGCLTYYKSEEDTNNAVRGALNLANSQLWIDSSDPQKFEITGRDKTKFALRASMLEEAKMWILAITQSKEYFKKHPDGQLNPTETILPVNHGHQLGNESSSTVTNEVNQIPESSPKKQVSILTRSNSVDSLNYEPPPTEENVTMSINSANTQFDLHSRLLDMLKNSLTSPGTKLEDHLGLISTLNQCLNSLNVLNTDTIQMLQKREEHYRLLYEKESKRNSLWTESLQALAKEHHHLVELYQEQQAQGTKSSKVTANLAGNNSQNAHEDTIETAEGNGMNEDEREEEDEDDEDEFFDLDDQVPMGQERVDDNEIGEDNEENTRAIDEIELEEIQVGEEKVVRAPIKRSYKGYPKDGSFRTGLPKFNSGTQPPAVSLWSVLKNAIGKDLTKISLPVHFNEPSSMLQRMAEDMEYSMLLDLASKQAGDGSERLLWVTAFAMSNYSSTDGRIAKPFNPLLGETFEYARPDRGYRYISEQVSHHPPISACYCESPNYIFYSEVDVKSNFWGKSYELLPQGVCHVYLVSADKKTVEHYTWKKVTTAITNLIVGNPTIEHYGEMEVINHSTKAVCKLNFKPNRWLSSERHVLEGSVVDNKGQQLWSLTGAWNQQLTATRVGGASDNDTTDSFANETTDVPGSKLSNFLANPNCRSTVKLWKRSPPPKEKIPFKLTPFAVTLNEMSPDLEKLLPPTDCRRRPDQRAMEDGLYDLGSEEKNRLEEKQRATRKEREAKLKAALESSPPSEHDRIHKELGYKPVWFEKAIDKDTNEGYWRFNHGYWKLREKAESVDEEPNRWEGVPRIF
ncbi:hypothetical protein K502DRAFT_323508 [Neoconidiobolus thromboides FSU 785]|nr:hypothetical protein K502DRAFT_323508 [Neoconidiobolus thromboides FSU 785]